MEKKIIHVNLPVEGDLFLDLPSGWKWLAIFEDEFSLIHGHIMIDPSLEFEQQRFHITRGNSVPSLRQGSEYEHVTSLSAVHGRIIIHIFHITKAVRSKQPLREHEKKMSSKAVKV